MFSVEKLDHEGIEDWREGGMGVGITTLLYIDFQHFRPLLDRPRGEHVGSLVANQSRRQLTC